jgi:hypothetical protein
MRITINPHRVRVLDLVGFKERKNSTDQLRADGCGQFFNKLVHLVIAFLFFSFSRLTIFLRKNGKEKRSQSRGLFCLGETQNSSSLRIIENRKCDPKTQNEEDSRARLAGDPIRSKTQAKVMMMRDDSNDSRAQRT